MRYQGDFLLPLKLQKISYYFGLCWKIILVNQFAEFFTFDLFDLLILIPDNKESVQTFLTDIHCMCNSSSTTVIFSKYFQMILCNKNMTAKACTIFTKKPLCKCQLVVCWKRTSFHSLGELKSYFSNILLKQRAYKWWTLKLSPNFLCCTFEGKKEWDKFLTAHF